MEGIGSRHLPLVTPLFGSSSIVHKISSKTIRLDGKYDEPIRGIFIYIFRKMKDDNIEVDSNGFN